jgi:hypothetical protein
MEGGSHVDGVRRLSARGRWKGKDSAGDLENNDRKDGTENLEGSERSETLGAAVRAASQPVELRSRLSPSPPRSDCFSDRDDHDWNLRFSNISAQGDSQATPALGLSSPDAEIAGLSPIPKVSSIGGNQRDEISWSATPNQRREVLPEELAIEAWLRGIDGDRGFIFAHFWPRISQASFSSAADVLIRYRGYRGEAVDFERFCQDFGVEKVGHRRLFQKWFTDNDGLERTEAPASDNSQTAMQCQ